VGKTLRLRSEGLEWRQVEDEVVALDTPTASYVAVNRSGAKLWAALAGGATREELIDTLVSEFAIAREQAANDVDAFVQMLVEQDMIREA
jgi:hypothetical protein